MTNQIIMVILKSFVCIHITILFYYKQRSLGQRLRRKKQLKKLLLLILKYFDLLYFYLAHSDRKIRLFPHTSLFLLTSHTFLQLVTFACDI